jgi:hypothetical protein
VSVERVRDVAKIEIGQRESIERKKTRQREEMTGLLLRVDRRCFFFLSSVSLRLIMGPRRNAKYTKPRWHPANIVDNVFDDDGDDISFVLHIYLCPSQRLGNHIDSFSSLLD